jgi:protein Mpv17
MFSNQLASSFTEIWQKPFTLNTADLTNFVLYAILSCPPNFLWQQFLEEKFPAYTETSPAESKKSDEKSVCPG